MNTTPMPTVSLLPRVDADRVDGYTQITVTNPDAARQFLNALLKDRALLARIVAATPHPGEHSPARNRLLGDLNRVLASVTRVWLDEDETRALITDLENSLIDPSLYEVSDFTSAVQDARDGIGA